MTERPTQPVLVKHTDGSTRLTLNRPARANSLTPDLLDALLTALEDPRIESCNSVVLTGAGHAFSTGGDVAEFHSRAHDHDALTTYSDRIVSTLNQVILKLAGLRCPVIAAVNGPVTGGSLGLVLTADMVLMDSHAFIQPYYAKMGFAPDGGWTAILPSLIGRARTMSWIATDRRLLAEELETLGIVDQVIEARSLETAIKDTIETIKSHDLAAIKSAKLLIGQTPAADRLAGRLDAERIAFLAQITRADTRARMEAFISRPSNAEKSGLVS
jgi:2-(1,2-epoxy-1,2-dihydrophenyl)acetyl-CoA isomerase